MSRVHWVALLGRFSSRGLVLVSISRRFPYPWLVCSECVPPFTLRFFLKRSHQRGDCECRGPTGETRFFRSAAVVSGRHRFRVRSCVRVRRRAASPILRPKARRYRVVALPLSFHDVAWHREPGDLESSERQSSGAGPLHDAVQRIGPGEPGTPRAGQLGGEVLPESAQPRTPGSEQARFGCATLPVPRLPYF